MEHDPTPTESRQGERRRSPRRALIWGLIIGIILLTIIWIWFARSSGV